MHRLFLKLVTCCTIVAVSGCAIRPDIEPYALLDTYEVIKHVRCELRDALRTVAKRAIGNFNPSVAAQLNEDSDFVGFDFRRELDEEAVRLFSTYSNSIVGTEFTFDMTENNNVSVGVDILNTFSLGTLKIGGGASQNLSRNSVEKSRSIDTFERLATSESMSRNYCGDVPIGNRNFLYPIAGKLNLEPIVRKFFDYNQSANLAGFVNGKAKSEFSVTLKYTTTLSADVAAVAAYPPRTRRWQIAGIDGSADASRSDVHTLSIVFVIPATNTPIASSIAENRAQEELNYLRGRDDLRTFGRQNF